MEDQNSKSHGREESEAPITVQLGMPSNAHSAISSKQVEFNIEVDIQNHSLQFYNLSVSVKFDTLNLRSNQWKLKPDELEIGSSLMLGLQYAERMDGEDIRIYDEQTVEVTIEIEEDGNTLAVEKGIVKVQPPAVISADVAEVYSIVFQQNQFPLISRLDITNLSPDSIGLMQVVAEFDPPQFEKTVWNIDELASEQTVNLKEKHLKLSASTLASLTEKQIVSLKVSVLANDRLVSEFSKTIELLPKNQWGGELHMPELLSAFVTPNTNYCDALLKKASNLLAKEGQESKLDGYRSNTRERPYMVSAALWSVICNEGISYCVPPASFATGGQKIRTSSDISSKRLATCLDMALLFAGCIEQAGLNGVIALTKGHAMVGVWLINESFPLLTNDDPVDLRNRIALKDLVLFESTLATNDRPINFGQAIREADKQISEEVERDFVYVVDLKQSRSRQINPIDFGAGEALAQSERLEKQEVNLPPPPVLPPVNDQELEGEDLSPYDRVDLWRRKLLDLSKRNKLLNIRQRSMGFKIFSPDLSTLEDELSSGKKFNINSKETFSTKGRSEAEFTQQTGEHLEDEFVRDQFNRGTLIADANERDLDKNLINLFRRAKSDLQEGGANTLFLSFGMLRWKEDAASELSYKAPLILLPVKLDRTSARSKPKIMQLPDEVAVFNLTLIELLEQDFEIDLSMFQGDLPSDGKGVDVREIWNTVRIKVRYTPGFEVVEDLCLGNFSFAKYLMWKDLSDRTEDLKKSPLVSHLIEKPTSSYQHQAEFIAPSEVDEKVHPVELFAPLNADSSQIVAIKASTEGADMVIEGPPGTGKSETIANIIAHNMAVGRKVLFVSEKMAALDVVYNRLKKVGIGHLCLELHSIKATKRNVIDQLEEAWRSRESASQIDWVENANQLGSLRRNLNRYVEELHRKSLLGYSPYEAIARSVGQASNTRINLGWSMDILAAPVKTESDVKSAKQLAKNLGLAFKNVVGLDFDQFRIVERADWSPVWSADLVDAARDLQSSVSRLEKSFSLFAKDLGLSDLESYSLDAMDSWATVAQVFIDSIDQSHDFALGKNSKQRLDDLDQLAEIKGEYDELIASTGLRIGPHAMEVFPKENWFEAVKSEGSFEVQYEKIVSVLSELRDLGFEAADISPSMNRDIEGLMEKRASGLAHNQIVRLPVSQWLEIKKAAQGKSTIARLLARRKINKDLRRNGLHKIVKLDELDEYVQLLKGVVFAFCFPLERCIDQVEKLVDLSKRITSIFDNYSGDGILDHWTTTAVQIRERQEYGRDIRRNFIRASSKLSDPNSFMLSVRKKLIEGQEFLEGSATVENAQNLLDCYEKTRASNTRFTALAGTMNSSEMNFQNLNKNLGDILSSAPDLNAWCHWIDAKNKAEEVGLGSLARGLELRMIEWNESESQFESALCNWAAPLLVSESRVLCNFSAIEHDELIDGFRRLDEFVASATGAHIAAKLAAEMPDTTGPNAPHEYGVLSRELQRKRGHMPVRQLISELGGCLLDLTPCFMMSPLSVAQYLPTDYLAFDLVVFDEASQITVWDAVGALARAKNSIIVGDPKQMPPTNFFSRANNDVEEVDLESILDQAMAVRVGYHRLTGHYRSRHESLITFSNHQYYQNSLTTYPCSETRDSAVTWHKVDGIYAKGASRNNPIEARAVVAEVVQRLNDPELQRLSIGIVTLNSEQQQLIENLLDDERRKDTKLERFFRDDIPEPVFVKNLETVQGDQRDVICLSIGYGPTELGAQTMSMNFGPLNKEGGERRLNVAITRASTEMLVFSSFDASMIDLSRTNAIAVRDLKAYIDYAARGQEALARQSGFINDVDEFDSDFEQAVAARLREKGWQIRTQIGVSKFRIDLGVLNPDVGGSFLAGIECDGASYHSSPSARDRDRVRQIILENLGWRLIRIWSTDYFIHPNKVIDRVHGQIEEILRSEREKREQKKLEEAKPKSSKRVRR